MYLPPTGSHLRSSHPPIPPFLLSGPQGDYPLVQINYRWNHLPQPTRTSSSTDPPALLSSSPGFANHPFPTPLHDTLHAWSWLVEEHLPTIEPSNTENSPTPPPSPPTFRSKPRAQVRQLLIYGSYLGGTLATSLALTESYASKSVLTRIHGLIVQNGIFDWTGVATSKDPLLESTLPDPSPDAYNSLLSAINTHAPYTLQDLHILKPARKQPSQPKNPPIQDQINTH